MIRMLNVKVPPPIFASSAESHLATSKCPHTVKIYLDKSSIDSQPPPAPPPAHYLMVVKKFRTPQQTKGSQLTKV